MKKTLLALSFVVFVVPSLTGCDKAPEQVEKQDQAAQDQKALGGEFKPSEGKKY